MSQILDELIDDAVALTESQLPSSDQVRTVLGALVHRFEKLETHVLGKAAPAVEQLQKDAVDTVAAAVTPPTPAAPVVVPSAADQLDAERQAEIKSLQARLAALTGTPQEH